MFQPTGHHQVTLLKKYILMKAELKLQEASLLHITVVLMKSMGRVALSV